ncbi:DUF5081 family protein [Enterococcus sp. AZ192]|uniref:DUF5081 family protein n=1 Tax=unclassified Enterococcus TaxID=2608891 RepID=UPI003D27BAF5
MTTIKTKESFTPEELFILLQSIDKRLLVGCPEIQDCSFTPTESSKKAEKLLKEKSIIDSDTNLTKHGADVIRFLELYSTNKKYIFVNSCFMTFYDDKGLGIIKSDDSYLFTQFTRQQFLEEVYLTNELLRGETGIKKVVHDEIINHKEKDALIDAVESQILSVGEITVQEDKIKNVKEWLFFVKNDQLVEIDVATKKIYHTSQELLNKRVVDTLGIAYEKGRGWFD